MSRGSRARSGALALVLAVISFEAAAADDFSTKGEGTQSCRSFYAVALHGYSAPDIFSAAPIADISLGLDLFQWPYLSPALGIHMYIPTDSLSLSAMKAGATLDLTIAYTERHPLSDRFIREHRWAPLARIGAGFPLKNLSEMYYQFSFSPLRIFEGSGYYSVGAASLLFDKSMGLSGWGIGLFEFTYMM